MAITLRGDSSSGKQSALTHAELDANFTTLGLAHGDSGANLDVSKLIVGGFTAEGTDPKIQSIGTAFDSHLLTRTADSSSGASDLISLMVQSDYATNSHNLTANQSAGIFGKFDTANKADVLGGGIKWVADNVTDTNNFNTHVQLSGYNTVSGTATEFQYILEPKTGVFPCAIKLTPTAYANLPANAGSGDDGLVAYLTTDGAGANKFQLIYSVGGAWKYVTDGTTVASS